MISAPHAQVTPEHALARLTLLSGSKEEEHTRRQSILSGQRPSLGEVNGRPVIGPLPETQSLVTESGPSITEKAQDLTGDPMETDTIKGPDSSSEDTLLDGSRTTPRSDPMLLDEEQKEQQQQIFEDKENLSPNPPDKALVARHLTPDDSLTPLASTSFSRVNEQTPHKPPVAQAGTAQKSGIEREISEGTLPDAQQSIDQATGDVPMASRALPPDRPPPFPPRPQTEDPVDFGAQQDVTEVIANVLFQLQCAIKPESMDETGEQIDKVKNLFYGKQKYYTTNQQGVIRTKEEYISDIKVDVASGPRDIYSALDAAFDLQHVEVGGGLEPQYATISQLPGVLQILVHRTQFDTKKQLAFKSIHHLELKDIIYLDRYMDSNDAELERRREECWSWKAQLSALETRKAELITTDVTFELSTSCF